MTKPWPTVRLGEVLTPVERAETHDLGRSMKRLQVKIAGRQGLHPAFDTFLPAILDRAFKGEL